MRHNPRRAIMEDSDRMPRPILSEAGRQKINGICSERGSCHAPTRTPRCATLNNRRPSMGGLFALSLELFSHFYLVPSFCLPSRRRALGPPQSRLARDHLSVGCANFKFARLFRMHGTSSGSRAGQGNSGRIAREARH